MITRTLLFSFIGRMCVCQPIHGKMDYNHYNLGPLMTKGLRRNSALFLLISISVSCQTLKKNTKADSRLFNYDPESVTLFEKARKMAFTPVSPIVKKLEWLEPYIRVKSEAKLAQIEKNLDQDATVHLGSRVGRTVKKNSPKSTYLTTDHLSLDLAGKVSDIANFVSDATPLPVHFSVTRQNKIRLTREFKTAGEAIFAAPYHPKNLPLTAERALRHMPNRTLVSIPTTLGFSLGIGQKINLGPSSAGALVGLFWSGKFTVNIFRKNNTQVIVSMIPEHSYGVKGGLSSSSKLNAFGINQVGKFVELNERWDQKARKLIEKALGFNFFSYDQALTADGRRLVLEYSFNIAKDSGREAFDHFFSKTFRLRANLPRYYSTDEYRSLAIADLERLEKLERLERSLPAQMRSVNRHVRYHESYEGISSGGYIGFKPHRFSSKKMATTHSVQFESQVDNSKSYQLTRFVDSRSVSSWIPHQSESLTYDSISVFEKDGSNHLFKGLRFRVSKEDERIGDTSFGNFRNSIKTILSKSRSDALKVDSYLLPPNIYNRLYANNLSCTLNLHFNARYIYDITQSKIIYPNGNDEGSGLKPWELFEKKLLFAAALTYEDSRALYQKPYQSVTSIIPTTISRISNWTKERLKSSLDSVKNFSFQSGEKVVVEQILKTLKDPNLPSYGPSYLGDVFVKLLNKSISARRIVPGFLSNLCSLYSSCRPYIHLYYVDNLNRPGLDWSGSSTVHDTEIDQLIDTMNLTIRDPESHYFQ